MPNKTNSLVVTVIREVFPGHCEEHNLKTFPRTRLEDAKRWAAVVRPSYITDKRKGTIVAVFPREDVEQAESVPAAPVSTGIRCGDLFRSLSAETYWGAQTARMRWLAARYYSGVETLEDLRAHAQPRPVAQDGYLRPLLTGEQVEEIIRLR